MKHIDIINSIMRIDTNTETFDMQEIENRRFMFSPKTGTLILGVQFDAGEMLFSHAEEYHRLGIREDFDKFVRGWVGTGKGYKHGVIHFAPNVPASVLELFDKAYDTLMMFRRNNANAKTVVLGFGRTWEQPLGNIITERQVDLMEDKTAVNYKTATGDPPKSVPAVPIELSGKTQKEKIMEITTKLEQGIKDLFASDKFKEYLSIISKLHRYSFRNSLLIFMQKPDASMVAGYTSWQKNFKRQVRKGEHGIKIFAPAPYKATKEVERIDKATNQRVIGKDGKPVTDTVEYTVPAFKITTVFDVSQTDGEPIPSLGVDELTGSVDRYTDFRTALEKISPVPIGFENIESGAKGYYSNTEKRIAVQEGMSEVQTLKTLIHEISHAKLHSVENITNIKHEEQIDRHTKEVEAESIAYTVCQQYGIDTSDYTFGYVAGWSSDKELPELKSSLATIQKAADEIITGIEEHFTELTKDKTVTHEKETYDHGFTELSEEEATEGAKIFEQANVDKTAPTAAEKTQSAAVDEKTIKAAVMDALKERIAYANDGMLSTYKMSEQSRSVLWDNKIRIDDKTVTQDGKPMFKINRRFSSRKTKGCYRELTPTLEYIGGKQQKPSIRKQLAETKGKSEPAKIMPAKKKEDLSL